MPDYKAKNSLSIMEGLTSGEIIELASSLESNQKHNNGDLILKESQIGKEGAKALAKALENNSRSIKPVNFNNLILPKTPNYALAAYDDYRVCISGSNRLVRPVEVDSERAAFTVGTYSESKIELSNRIVQTLKNMPRMHCVKEDMEKGEFTFVQKTGFLGFLEKGFFGFPDWIDIKVVSRDKKGMTSSFIMLSRSQYGYSDFGLNKERVQYCLDLINKVDSSATFSPYLPFTKSQHALAGAIASFAIAAIILALTGIVWPVVLGGALGVALVGGLLAVRFIPAAPKLVETKPTESVEKVVQTVQKVEEPAQKVEAVVDPQLEEARQAQLKIGEENRQKQIEERRKAEEQQAVADLEACLSNNSITPEFLRGQIGRNTLYLETVRALHVTEPSKSHNRPKAR